MPDEEKDGNLCEDVCRVYQRGTASDGTPLMILLKVSLILITA
ncbi:hypothetical protein [Cloacibacillus porcorum]|nr:hypothetical protein [Cloacibacillus porcorum]